MGLRGLPDPRVVDQREHDEDNVECREGDEELIERVVQLGLGQDDHADGGQVAFRETERGSPHQSLPEVHPDTVLPQRLGQWP